MAALGSLRGWATRLSVPVALFGLLVTAEANAAQLTASWVDNSSGVATTRIERRLASQTTHTAIADAPPGSETFVDTSVASGDTYCYRVFAWTDDSVSPYSSEVCATSAADSVAVSVTRAGTGSGTVTSSPAGINCGTSCSINVAPGTLVTLTATPASGSVFSGWLGGGCTGTAPCAFATNSSVTVTATFSPAPVTSYTVAVTKAGTGSGTVTSSPGSINCGTSCSTSVTAGTLVTLTAAPDSGSVFSGWSGGGCSGTAPCAFSTNSSVTVTATFNPAPETTPPPATTSYSLTLSTSGPGSITCNGASCSGTYPSGATVTLTASPNNKKAKLTEWGGACSGTAATCTLTMNDSKSVSAGFKESK
jgi:hypothetical protein